MQEIGFGNSGLGFMIVTKIVLFSRIGIWEM